MPIPSVGHESAEPQTLDEIRDWHRDIVDALVNQRPLAREYQKWHATLSARKQLRPNFDDDGILGVLKNANVVDKHIVGHYRECLRARHWVGHGRYWAKPVEVDRLDPDDVYERASALLRAMPA